MEDELLRQIIVWDILIPSLQELYHIDYDNIRFGVSERNICARLAHHMENIIHNYECRNINDFLHRYFVDVEYNRMGNGEPKCYENRDKRPKKMVSDLLIQSRGRERNLLAVEMKRKGNSQKVNEDKERLKSLVSAPERHELNCVYYTLIGAFIEYSPKDVKIELFHDVQGKGESVGRINCRYDESQESYPKLIVEDCVGGQWLCCV